MNDMQKGGDQELEDKPVFVMGLMIGIVASVIIAGFFILGLFTGKFLAERSASAVESSAVQVLRVRHG